MMRRIPMMFALIMTATTGARADEPKSAADWIAEGNAQYREGRYVDALEAYNEAELAKAPPATVAFNRGLAHYALGEPDKAAAEFGDAMLGGDRELEARSRFNLGNCSYATALKQQQENPKAAIESLKRAISHYADTMEMLPGDEPTAENMQLAQSLIRQLQEQQQQQQQQQQQNQDEQQNDQQDQQQQDQQQQPQSQPSEDQQQQNQQDQQDEQDQEQQQNQQQQEQQEQQQQQQNEHGGEDQQSQQQPQPQEGEAQGEPQEMKMSKEQAQRLLQAVRDKEKARREQKQEQRRVLPAPSGKDW